MKLYHPAETAQPQTPPMQLAPSSSSAAEALAELRAHAAALRASGQEAQALALGPSILHAHFLAEQGRPFPAGEPRTFCEKIYRRMFDMHEHGCPTYTQLADKLAVREFVAGRVGESRLTPLLWSGDDAREIPWSRLPGEVMFKCSEGSRKGARLELPRDMSLAVELAQQWQSESFYWVRREYQYWPMPRRLLVEPILDDGHPDGPIDYIFFCFDGVPRLVQVGSRSHTLHRFFTPAWDPLELTYREVYETWPLPRPTQLDEMLELAARLSAGFDFVRVDLYQCGERVRFGELTFTPCAGMVLFRPAEWDERLGSWWRYAGLPDG